jgi:uncharacterized protein (DUF58 family)
VRRIEVQTRRLVRDVMAGGYLSVFRGAGIEFDKVREYAEGDDRRAVDWSVTARMGRPFVKTYVDVRETTVVFLVDLSASMRGGFGVWSARQTAARLVACLALSAVRNGDKVGLLAFTDRVESWVPPRKGAGHALRIVRDCLALPAAGKGTDLVPPLDFLARVVRKKAVAFLVSDFLFPDSPDRWKPALARAARRHDVVAVRLGLPEAEPLGRGLLRVRDPERGGRSVLDGRSPAARAAWAGEALGRRLDAEEALRRCRVDRMDVSVPREPGRDVIAEPILRFFRMREERGTKR